MQGKKKCECPWVWSLGELSAASLWGGMNKFTGRTSERQFLCPQSPFREEETCSELQGDHIPFLVYPAVPHTFPQGSSPSIPTVQSSFWELLFLTLERQDLSPGCALRCQEADGCQFRLGWNCPGNGVWNNHQGGEVMKKMGMFLSRGTGSSTPVFGSNPFLMAGGKRLIFLFHGFPLGWLTLSSPRRGGFHHAQGQQGMGAPAAHLGSALCPCSSCCGQQHTPAQPPGTWPPGIQPGCRKQQNPRREGTCGEAEMQP